MKEMLLHKSNIEKNIATKVFLGERISVEDAIYLYENSNISFCAYLANHIKERKFGKEVYYNKNTHIEISNRCINKCKFCSFYREEGMPDCWDLEIPDVIKILTEKIKDDISEVHLTGGLHPEKTSKFYCKLFTKIKDLFPQLHIKAFTAVEIEYFAKSDNKTSLEILKGLKANGLNSLAGGGAEILDDSIRREICPEKTNSETWLRIHQEAHSLGLSSNCTMLYGHIENIEDRVNHMDKLRELQDSSRGFNCFIPLKYKTFGNRLNLKNEINLSEELKTYSISRIFLDNIAHLKAYWPMTGKEYAALSLSFGVDDMDGTISDSTKIYSMAGSKEQKPEMTANEMIELIENQGFVAIERSSEYKTFKR
jgi:aminodeoxyfutalosine synthase